MDKRKYQLMFNVIGANWSEPAHTTYFLEIVSNQTNPQELVETFYSLSKSWQKDLYVLTNNTGIRARMLCAMIREAFYLVENGYVSIEDSDVHAATMPGSICHSQATSGTWI